MENDCKSNITNMGGLLAIGCSEGWQIDLEEINGDAQPSWGLVIANRSFHIQLEIATLDVLSRLASFLNIDDATSAEMCIGSWRQAKVIVLRDEGRKQIRIVSAATSGTEWSALLELNLMPDQIKEFVEALRDLLKNLAEYSKRKGVRADFCNFFRL